MQSLVDLDREVVFEPPEPTDTEFMLGELVDRYNAAREHTIWPWVSYLVSVLAGAYEDFEQRVAIAGDATGSKQDRVRHYILDQAPIEFRRRDIERALPGISNATIRLVLNELRDTGQIRAESSGPAARWRRLT